MNQAQHAIEFIEQDYTTCSFMIADIISAEFTVKTIRSERQFDIYDFEDGSHLYVNTEAYTLRAVRAKKVVA